MRRRSQGRANARRIFGRLHTVAGAIADLKEVHSPVNALFDSSV